MLVEHRGMRPEVDSSAWVAPTAVVCGDVTIGADAGILWNAGVVHLHSTVAAGGVVPIGWVVAGDEALQPDRDDRVI
jgi:hypothetical protein